MTIKYDNVYVLNTSTVAGIYEKEGPLCKYFDKTYDDFYMGEDSFEKAETKMILDSVDILLKKVKKNENDIDLFISGNLLNQIVPSNYAAIKLGINYMGCYSACATSALSIALGASMLQNKGIKNIICNVSSHNSAAEKQFRNPVEYGTLKPDTTTFTATGAASCILSNKKSKIKIESSTIGTPIDYKENNPLDVLQ